MTLNHMAASALISSKAIIGENVQVWDYSQIREGAVLGANCHIGKGVYVGTDVRIGSNCKIQNSALIYEGSCLGNQVFIGPGVILTNDHNPRATREDGNLRKKGDWQQSGVIVLDGVSIGAGAVCIAPITIGSWSMIGAGSVVTKNVDPYSLVIGNPARLVGWVGEAGVRLVLVGESKFLCPVTGKEFVMVDGQLRG